MLFFGGGPNHDRLGFRYWQHPGAFKPYATTGNTGKFLAFWTALVRSGFAFILSPELVCICAGESEAPRRNIPKAAGRFIYRLSVFYILGSLVISIIVASNDPLLLQAVSSGKTNAGASPFVLGIQRAGIKGLNQVINAVILTSAWSAANSFLFAGSRSLYSLAVTGQAPKIFRTCNKQGVPYIAVLFSAALACLVYLSVSSGSAAAFAWFLNIATISGFIAWIVLLMTYLVSSSSAQLGIYRYPDQTTSALPKSLEFQQRPRSTTIQNRTPTVLHMGHARRPRPLNPHERLPGLLSRQLLRGQLPRSLHHPPHLRNPLRRPQDLVQNTVDVQSIPDRRLHPQGGGRSFGGEGC